ncbi:KAP P-loop domain-containing protein [Pseudomonas syringae pv. maculicola]|uniref:KAP family P-loop NTPase fold protein n=1 Tax=Pseudomonas syringae group genomosp. 3 TaxID=251701 RepID=UPI000F0094E9|nr:P-loop NTPase fold protein [Pseudomonas syringae group genomosp. 3]RMO81766.1 KAP P-loop domain-containing protein [Pseudomonas syringae pv. maculicola]
MLDSRRSMPAVLDRHIETEDQDAFGHRHYAQALRCLIEDQGHRPPFSIGLLGGWGTGKSSVKELYTRALADDTSTAGGRHPRSQRFKSITFNAWRFGGKEQDIKRALLRHVFLELGGDEGKLHDELYRNVTHTESVTKPIRELTKQHLISWAAPAPAFLIAFLFYLVIVAAGLSWLPLHNSFVQSLFLAAITGIYYYLIKVMKPSAVSPFNTITRVHLPSVSAEQYEELLLQQLRKFKPARSNAVPYERLVIFVDDLDRLSAEEMVLGLDAVRTFMEIPTDKLPENLGLVFVISCDEGKVADALSRRRGNPEQPGSIFNPTDARRYLDRIFQFRLEIPPPPRNDMRQFALSKLKDFPELVKEVADEGASVEQVVDRMIHTNVSDPRNALQIVNAFTQTWWLAKARELDAIGSERPGGLHEGAVTKHPIALGALSAARVSFPGFYRDLQDDPQLLHRLTNLMVRQTLLKDEPLESQHILKRYVAEDDKGKTILVEGCRDLRQFLASLVGIHWPDSLQSLLLLSEDFATRQYGGHASRIYSYLVSGDTQGFLEALSPRANEFLSDKEMELLHGMLSELHRTEEALKFNAMRVVADVIDRLPPRTRSMVLGILCNDIVTSGELRSLLGVEKISRITAVANATDQQLIASVLIDELLTIGKPSTMRLQSGQTPNMEEAIAMAKGAAEIALSVLDVHGLPAHSKAMFMAWLCERNILADAGSYTLRFIELQQWVDRFETAVLPEIGASYVEQLTNALHQFEAQANDDIEPLESLDLQLTAIRINTVWERLAAEGEESRTQLWQQVTKLSTITASELIDSVINALERYVPHANDETLLDCLARFSLRVASFNVEPLDYKRAFRLLVDLGAPRLAQFNDDHYERYAALAISLSGIEGCQEDACEVFRTFVVHNADALSQVADNWIGELLHIPSACRIELFSAYASLGEADQESLVTYLKDLTSNTELDSDDEALYSEAATHIPAANWEDGYLQPHLDALLPTLHTKVNNWPSYLPHILPGLTKMFTHATPGVLGPALQKLVSTAKSYEDALDPLHGYFIGLWPTVEQLPTGYAPQTLFAEAQQTAVSSPGFVGRNTLASLNSMLSDGVIPQALSSNLVETACVVWQQRPLEAADFLSTGVDLSITQIAELSDAIDYNKPEEVALLERVWKTITPNLSIVGDLEATKAVLVKGKRGSSTDPDLCLALWCRALGMEAHSNLKKLILAEETSDGQRTRLLHQIIRNEGQHSEKESKEIPALALQLLKMEESPLTWAAVNALRADVNKRFLTHEDRLAYARLLLSELANGGADTAKGHIVSWAKALGTEAVLRDVRPEVLSEGDVTIINNIFGNSRAMTGLWKRWKNRQ